MSNAGGAPTTTKRQRRRLLREGDYLPLMLWAGDEFVRPIVEAQSRGDAFYGSCMTSLNARDDTHQGTAITRELLEDPSELGLGGQSPFARVFAGVGEGASMALQRASRRREQKKKKGGGGGGDDDEDENDREDGEEKGDDDDDDDDDYDIPLCQLGSRRSATPARSDKNGGGGGGGGGAGGAFEQKPFTAHEAELVMACKRFGFAFERIAEVLPTRRGAHSVSEFWHESLKQKALGGGAGDGGDGGSGGGDEPAEERAPTTPWFTAVEMETMDQRAPWKTWSFDDVDNDPAVAARLLEALDNIAAALNLVPKPAPAPAAPEKRKVGRPKKSDVAAAAAAAGESTGAMTIKRSAIDVEVYYRLNGYYGGGEEDAEGAGAGAGVNNSMYDKNKPALSRQAKAVRYEPWEIELINRMKRSGCSWEEIMAACPRRTKMSLEKLWYSKLSKRSD